MSPLDGIENSLRRAHALKFSLSGSQLLNDNAGKFLRHINISQFHGFQLLIALVIFIQNLRLADCELVALTAHIFN